MTENLIQRGETSNCFSLTEFERICRQERQEVQMCKRGTRVSNIMCLKICFCVMSASIQQVVHCIYICLLILQPQCLMNKVNSPSRLWFILLRFEHIHCCSGPDVMFSEKKERDLTLGRRKKRELDNERNRKDKM